MTKLAEFSHKAVWICPVLDDYNGVERIAMCSPEVSPPMSTTAPRQSSPGPPASNSKVVSRALAGAWMIAAVAWTPWSLDWLLGSITIEETGLRRALWAASLIFLVASMATLAAPRSRSLDRVQALLLSTFLLAPLTGESILRLCIAADMGNLRNPKLFADSYADDDFWRLKRSWNLTGRMQPHASLGWGPPKTLTNPLGIIRSAGYAQPTEEVVLCFGDSFMAGRTPHPDKIPDILEELLERETVFNYGVGGYGVGQIFQHYREEHLRYEDPIIVVGIFARDLDRTILSFRGAPKPRFHLEQGQLIHDAPEFSSNPEDWDEEFAPRIRSYELAAILRQLRLWSAEGRAEDSPYRRQQKLEVNRALIEATVEEARAHGQRILFITFPSPRDLGRAGWRLPFLKGVFKDLKVPHVDGSKALRIRLRETGDKARDYYLPDNHPNAAGNRIFAEALAERIRKLKKRRRN